MIQVSFVSKQFNPAKSDYDWKTFAGAGVGYSFQSLNNAMLYQQKEFI